MIVQVNSDSSTILYKILKGPDMFKLWTHHSHLPLTTMMTGISQQPSGHSSNKTFCKETSDSKQKIQRSVWTNI